MVFNMARSTAMSMLLLLGLTMANAATCPVPSECEASDSGARPSTCYPSKPGYFEDLTPDEVKAVIDYLKPKAAGLGFTNAAQLTRFGYGVPGVIVIDRFLAPKKEVLAYLDQNKPEPERAAIVHTTITKGSNLVRVAYKLGPLSNITYMTQIPVIQGRMEVDLGYVKDFNAAAASTDGTESDLVYNYVSGILKPIIKSLFPNATIASSCPTTDCLSPRQLYLFPQPVDRGDGTFRAFNQWGLAWNNTDEKGIFEGLWFGEIYFLQFTFEYKVGLPYNLTQIWFLGENFRTPEELIKFWNSGVPPTADPKEAAKMKAHLKRWKTLKFDLPSTKDDVLFSTFRDRPGPKREPTKPIGPLAYEPYGHRFTITRKHIEWEGWSVEVGTSKGGPRFFDIRFKGERIAYEVSVQEALAAYAGPDPNAARTFYYDSATFTMGWDALQLIHGVDCPINSGYLDLDVTPHIGGADRRASRRNMCVFEHDGNMPLASHTPWDASAGGAVRNTELFIRVKATVGNYDYYHQLVLSLDGALRGEVSLTGYVHGVNYIKDFLWDRYSGGPVSPLFGGILHDHTMVWKVDADIGGTDNYVTLTKVKAQKVTDYAGLPWTNKFVQAVKQPTELAMRFNPDKPTNVHIRSSTQTNKWGKARGYTIYPTRLHSNVFPDDTPELRGREWIKYHLAITKYNDQEYTCTMEPDPMFPSKPILQFDQYLNKESIDGEDLVAWITSGVYHIPHAEDAPVTPTVNPPYPGFAMLPFNFHDESACMDMPDLWYARQDGSMDKPENAPIIQKYIKGDVCTPQYEDQSILDFVKNGWEII